MLRSRRMPPPAPSRHGGLPRQEMVPSIPPGRRPSSTWMRAGLFGAQLQRSNPSLRHVGIEPDPVTAKEAAGHYEQVTCGRFPDDLPAAAVRLHRLQRRARARRGSLDHARPGEGTPVGRWTHRGVHPQCPALHRGPEPGPARRWTTPTGASSTGPTSASSRGPPSWSSSTRPTWRSRSWPRSTRSGCARAALLVGPFRDMRYTQFAVVARPRVAGPPAEHAAAEAHPLGRQGPGQRLQPTQAELLVGSQRSFPSAHLVPRFDQHHLLGRRGAAAVSTAHHLAPEALGRRPRRRRRRRAPAGACRPSWPHTGDRRCR